MRQQELARRLKGKQPDGEENLSRAKRLWVRLLAPLAVLAACQAVAEEPYEIKMNVLYDSGLGSTDFATSISVCNSHGDIYIGGATGNMLANAADGLILLYNSSGNLQCSKAIATGVNDVIFDVASLDTSWPWAHAAYVSSGANLMRIGTYYMCDLFQTATFTGPLMEMAVSTAKIKLDLDIGYVAGMSMNTSFNLDFRTVKVNVNTSTILWATTYDSGRNDTLTAIDSDDSSNVYVTGYTANVAGDDIRTIKYDTSGNRLWSVAYDSGGSNGDHGADIVADERGYAYVCGDTTTVSTRDVRLIKYRASDGAVIWNKTLDTGQSEWGQGVGLDPAGNVFVAFTRTSPGGVSEAGLAKYSADGNLLWYLFCPGTNIAATDLAMDLNGNAYIVCNEGYSSEANIRFLKYGPAKPPGDKTWPKKAVIYPNILLRSSPQPWIDFKVEGDPGTAVEVRVLDAAATQAAKFSFKVEGDGSGIFHYFGDDGNGKAIASGVYVAIIKAGSATSKLKFAIVRKKSG